MASSPISSSTRLNRLLDFIQNDAEDLVLRKRAIRHACDTGHWEIARALITTGLQVHPDEAELLALSGFAYLRAEQYVDAAQILAAALAQGLDSADVRFNLAFAQFMLKRYAQALEHLTSPLVSLEFPLALLLRARCLHHLARLAEAIADCGAHLARAPNHAETHGLLSLLLHGQGHAEEAKPHIDAALRQYPRQLEAMLALALTQLDAEDYDAARSSFNALLQAHPQCGFGWLGLALIELADLQVEEAKRAVELAAAHIPDHVGTWHVLAWIALMRTDTAAAERAFDRALALDRNLAETHGGLALIAALQGRDEDARVSIERALQLDPQSMSAPYAQMLLLQVHGQYREAHAMLEAFLARPVTRNNRLYRDLVFAHVRYLRMRAGANPTPAIYH